MTKPHRITKKIFPRFPILVTPLVLSCVLAASVSAQDAPAPAANAEVEVAAAAAEAAENNAPQRNETENGTAPNVPKTEANQASAVNTGTPDAATPENKTTGRAAQVVNGTAEASAPQDALNGAAATDAEPARSQRASVPQSERIKPRAFGAPPASDPASRARSRQKRLEGIVRGVMSQAGFTDLPMQGYIAAHMANEDQARGPLRKKGEQLFLALKSVRVTNVQIDELLREFQKALDDDRARRLQCEANLDAKIGYTKNSRLQAVLVLFGIIGDGALFVPLREPPRPRPTVPVRSDAPAKPLENGTVNASVVSAAGNATAETAQSPQAASPKIEEDDEPDEAAVKKPAPATYDVSTTQPVAKDRASFK